MPYGVGKAALDRMTADTGKELADTGVTVVSLWPGAVRTETVVEVYSSEKHQETRVSASVTGAQRFKGGNITCPPFLFLK